MNPTAVKIVNDALKQSGHEATFDYKLKSLLILIVEAALRRGYIDGYNDSNKGLQPKITPEKLIDFVKIYKQKFTQN